MNRLHPRSPGLVYFRLMSRGLYGSVACAGTMLALAVGPSVAAAATGKATTPATPGTPVTAPTTTPTPAPAAAKGSVRLYLLDAFFVSRQPITVPNRTIHVGGVVRPYVPGQRVTVKTFLGSHRIKLDSLRVKPSRKGTYGTFTEKLSVPAAGKVSVQVAHHREAQQVGFVSRRRFSVVAPNAGFGASGPFVALMQQRLAALHFYIPQTGVYDGGMRLAVDAYHRLLGHGVSQSLDAGAVSDLLNGVGQFHIRFPSHGRHAEGDLSRQVLALIDKGKVVALYPISSGKPSTPTVLGSFRVYLKTPGYLPDGMFFSNFFTGGYAIHGFTPAPDFPASHGCMRVPIVDAISIYNWLSVGDGVDVYYESR
jgi:L,D-transpeptidase catalytic domain